ncbi:MAG: efflux RND transporter periplasmic adaptor subunit [Coxiellaceae bacterium]|nr:efflux RND transporter periplasmic adaptor subunit [Coxiellaceae bacterium]
MKNYKEPDVTVSAEKATSQTWHPFLTAAGSLKASNGVDVNAQVSGQITAIEFKSGQHVKQGDLLVQLDDSVDQQTLLRDQAALLFNKVDYERKQSLLKQRAVAQSAVDAAKAAYLQADAAVQSDQVLIAQKKIKAPFTGKIGIRQVNVGQYITSSTAIVTLQALDPLLVDFSLPEQDFPKISKDQDITIRVDAYPTQTFAGKIVAVNSAVDVNTRSIAVRATIPNPKEVLFPGLFANVAVILPVVNNVITVPQTAVTYSMYGDSVYVVENKGKEKIAVQKYVLVGDRRDNVAEITKGIVAGDEVITSGQLKLHPNATVVINNAVNLN